MSKKRRMFDIEFDDALEDVPAGTSENTGARRGPMASAINENADALRQRKDAEQAIREENDALAQEHVRLKKEGLITDLIPLDLIDTDKLTRDREPGRDDEIDELKQSILETGLSNPIRVERAGERYELIQGFRRLSSFRELAEEVGAPYDRIPAVLNATGEDRRMLYRRMVDENLVRRGVSFGELAQLAIAYRNEDPNVTNYHEAVELVFASASRQKRSHIRSFVELLGLTRGELRHVKAISRAMGNELLRKLNADGAQGLLEALSAYPDRDEAAEQKVLRTWLAEKPKKAAKETSGKTSLRMNRPEGVAKCIAAPGRVDLRLDRDFSTIDRAKLERALAKFFEVLDE